MSGYWKDSVGFLFWKKGLKVPSTNILRFCLYFDSKGRRNTLISRLAQRARIKERQWLAGRLSTRHVFCVQNERIILTRTYHQQTPQFSSAMATGGYASEAARGLLVLLCGIPGCGKDLLGRACAKSLNGAALSQDEHHGNATSTLTAFEALLLQGTSPILLLRNGLDVGDRLPYVLSARRNGYRVVAVWPEELSLGERRAALFLASLAGCYGRLSEGGRSGHETLTVSDKLCKPAQVCLQFLQMFRAPSAPGEVDAVMALPFLQSNLLAFEESLSRKLSEINADMGKGKSLPPFVQEVFDGNFDRAKAKILKWGDARRAAQEIIDELLLFLRQQMSLKAETRSYPEKAVDTKRLQRAAKIRAAVEHLVSPYNLAACREGGSTVTLCQWFMVEDRLCPAWPTSYFAGAPQLKKWGTTLEDVLDAANESLEALAPLQEGDKGVRVQLLKRDEGVYVSPVEVLPEASLRKLRCPDIARAAGWRGRSRFGCGSGHLKSPSKGKTIKNLGLRTLSSPEKTWVRYAIWWSLVDFTGKRRKDRDAKSSHLLFGVLVEGWDSKHIAGWTCNWSCGFPPSSLEYFGRLSPIWPDELVFLSFCHEIPWWRLGSSMTSTEL